MANPPLLDNIGVRIFSVDWPVGLVGCPGREENSLCSFKPRCSPGVGGEVLVQVEPIVRQQAFLCQALQLLESVEVKAGWPFLSRHSELRFTGLCYMKSTLKLSDTQKRSYVARVYFNGQAPLMPSFIAGDETGAFASLGELRTGQVELVSS